MDSLIISWLVIWAVTLLAGFLEDREYYPGDGLKPYQWLIVAAAMLFFWPVFYFAHGLDDGRHDTGMAYV